MSYLQNAAAKHAHTHLLPRWLIHLGIPGVFVVSAIDASIIPLPLPGSTDILVLLLAAQHSMPWLLWLAAVSGSILGGYLTWSAGKKGGETMLVRYVPKRFLTPLSGWIEKHGIMGLCVASVLPPPIPLMPFLLTAGALGISRRQFLIAFGAARAFRYGLIVWIGVTYGRHVLRLWSRYLAGWSNVILWTFLGLLAAAIVFGVWKYRRDQRVGRTASPVSAGAA